MATVINNPGDTSGSGAGLIIGIIVAIVLIGLFVFYGVPALRDGGSTNVNVDLPSVNLPDTSGAGGGAVTE